MNWLEQVIELSPVNGGLYNGHQLEPCAWRWPENTWLQLRRAALKEQSNESKKAPER